MFRSPSIAAQTFQSARPEAGSGPVTESVRITSLDLIRGAAVLGILLMNAVAFKFGLVPYLNLSAGGSETLLDWSVGIFGEIFVDQKFMGLFSFLFGAGILLFIERAEAKDRRPILLNLWRQRPAAGHRHPARSPMGGRRVDRLRRFLPLPDRHEETPAQGAHRRRRRSFSALRSQLLLRAAPRQCDRRIAGRSMDVVRGGEQRGDRVQRRAIGADAGRLFSAWAGNDSHGPDCTAWVS